MRGALVSILIFITLLTVPYSSATSASNVLNNAAGVFIGIGSYANTVPLKAYSLLALNAMAGKVNNNTAILLAIKNLTYSLLALQNPDGGWGYYKKEISTPQDTALALISLNSSLGTIKRFEVPIDKNEILNALKRGENYLLAVYSSPGWGYAPKTRVEFYPTALSLWALGSMGLKYSSSSVIKTAADFISSFSNLSPEYEAMRLIAFHAIDYPNITPYLSRCEHLLSQNNLTEFQRAILTYAVILYTPLSFDVGKSLTILKELGLRNNTYLLVNTGMPFMVGSNLISTAYAVMAFSRILDNNVKTTFVNPRSYLYNELIHRQNSDGGWPLFDNGPSSSKATYYALVGISASKNPSKEIVKRAVIWAENHLPVAEREVRKYGIITDDYYYTVMILTKFGNISKDQRSYLINLTRSLEVSPGLWSGLFGIPQPYQTALGLNILINLGYHGKDITLGTNWLLSISPLGWGIRLNNLMPAVIGMNVPVTDTVLEVLSKTVFPSSQDKLEPHIRWLINQRFPNGAWGYFRGNNIMPSLEYTIQSINVLKKLGYDFSKQVLSWVLGQVFDSNLTTVEIGLSLKFLSSFNFLPATTLSEVIAYLSNNTTWGLYYWDSPEYKIVAQKIGLALSSSSKVLINISPYLAPPRNGSYIIIAPLGLVNVSQYNPFVSVNITTSCVIINNQSYPSSGVILLIPGRTEDGGYILLVLVGKNALKGVSVLFTTGLYQYLHGEYMVLRVVDINNDGKIEPNELVLLKVGESP